MVFTDHRVRDASSRTLAKIGRRIRIRLDEDFPKLQHSVRSCGGIHVDLRPQHLAEPSVEPDFQATILLVVTATEPPHGFR